MGKNTARTGEQMKGLLFSGVQVLDPEDISLYSVCLSLDIIPLKNSSFVLAKQDFGICLFNFLHLQLECSGVILVYIYIYIQALTPI